jgi:hypothetical protein
LSTKKKGQRTKYKALTYWQDLGYITDTVEQGGRFNKSKDLFSSYCSNCWQRYDDETNCCKNKQRFSGFDIVALKPKEMLLIQLKTNTPSTQAEYIQFAKQFANRYMKVIVQTWYDRKGWRIQYYQANGKIREIDLRK